jgi:hypothetical protein
MKSICSCSPEVAIFYFFCIFIRGFYSKGIVGFMLGFVVPIIPTVLAEQVQTQFRGRAIVFVNGIFSVG